MTSRREAEPIPPIEPLRPKKISHVGGFIAGGIAACAAVTVTNPIELVKTRMQLQGELASRGQVHKVYTGLIQGLTTIAKNEGIVNVQRGLFPAVC